MKRKFLLRAPVKKEEKNSSRDTSYESSDALYLQGYIPMNSDICI